MPYLNPAPSLREVAERLSLIQRWNGRTTVPWTVLQHSLLTATLLPADANNPYLRLVTLMHDAGEAYTGDIPHGFKAPEQAQLELDILAEIYEGLSLVPPCRSGFGVNAVLRKADDFAALVEAQCICSPAERREVTTRLNDIYGPPLGAAVAQGEKTLWSMRDMPRRDAIDTWVTAVEKLIAALIVTEEERI